MPSVNAAAEFKLKDETYALDAKIDSAVFGSITLGGYGSHTEHVTDLLSVTSQMNGGVYAKTGLVYAVVMVAMGVCATAEGQPASVWIDNLSQYMQQVSQSCPFK